MKYLVLATGLVISTFGFADGDTNATQWESTPFHQKCEDFCKSHGEILATCEKTNDTSTTTETNTNDPAGVSAKGTVGFSYMVTCTPLPSSKP